MGTISDPVPNPYKDITEFAARQVSESRQMFERFYKLTFGSIAIVAALITGGFYFLVGREYRDIESKVQATVGKKTDEEIARLQQEVRARIEAEFKTENLHRLVRERCDTLVRIPLRGQIESLNVSVAAGVILYEALRQRSARNSGK